MPGVANFLLIAGLIMFSIGLILLTALDKRHHRGWMWALLFIGLIFMIVGVFLWFTSRGGGEKAGGLGELGELGELALL